MAWLALLLTGAKVHSRTPETQQTLKDQLLLTWTLLLSNSCVFGSNNPCLTDKWWVMRVVCEHSLDTSIFMLVSPSSLLFATCRRNQTSVSTFRGGCLPSDSHLIGYLPKMNRTTFLLSAQRQDTLINALFPLGHHSCSKHAARGSRSHWVCRLFRRPEQPLFKTLDPIAVKRKPVEMNIKYVLRSRLALRFQRVSRARHDVPRPYTHRGQCGARFSPRHPSSWKYP